VAVDDLGSRRAGDPFGGLVEAQNPALDVGRCQATGQAADHVLAERLKIGQLVRRLLERGAGAAQTLRQQAAQRGHRDEPEDVKKDDEERDALLRPRVGADDHREGGRAEVLRARQASVHERAQHADHHPGPLRLDGARRNDRQRVERREIARDSARQVDERRDDDRVAGQLHVDEPAVLLGVAQQQDVKDGQRVGQADQKEEGINRQRSRRLNLDQNRRPEQERDDRGAAANQPQESATEIRSHFSWFKVQGSGFGSDEEPCTVNREPVVTQSTC
jgi:hypothetical protein